MQFTEDEGRNLSISLCPEVRIKEGKTMEEPKAPTALLMRRQKMIRMQV
jgi:hypothetical protein